MKNQCLAFLASALLVSCLEEKQTKSEEPHLELKDEGAKSNWTTYVFQNAVEYDSLIVQWLNDSSIQFNVKRDNGLCTFEQSGFATCKLNVDSEIDETEEGEAYPSTEYYVSSEGEVFAIRIELGEQSRAKVRYIHKENVDECVPENSSILKRISN